MHGVRLGSAASLIVKGLAEIAAGDEPQPVPMFPLLVIVSCTTLPWSSATFDGERHCLELRLLGDVEVVSAALDRLIDNLPHADFNLPGQIVAECRIVRMSVDPDPATTAVAMTVHALTVVD